ncbi:hypothetical protein HMSSN036_62980 [Paenibacillus macerans]|nr:hypothetical protein HMSSN036_62980 [Paenibacillus macerans]
MAPMSHETAMNSGGLQAIRSASSPGSLRSARIEEQNRLHGRFASMPILEWNARLGNA